MKKISLAVIASTSMMFVINMLAVLLPLNGKSTKFLSDQYAVYFTPASYVFSIWSLIYIALFYYLWYQSRNQVSTITNKWFVGSNILNALWIVAWHYEQVGLSVVIMLGLLYTLIKTYQGIHSAKHPLLVRSVFGLYLGWISVATIANITVLLFKSGWDGWGVSADSWNRIMMYIAGALGVTMMIKYRDYVFPGVVLWAIIGIYAKWPQMFGIETAIIVSVTIVSAVMNYLNTKTTPLGK